VRLHPSSSTLKTVADLRAKPPAKPERCGIPFDLTKFDFTKPYVGGVKPEQKIGPARALHIDFSPKGAAKMLRYVRADIEEAASDIVEAEDAGQEARRYTLFSVWRTLKTVEKDPIAVCDPGTVVRDRDLIEHFYKVIMRCKYL
jgi:hypothetical protein